MAGNAISISILADAGKAVSEMQSAGTAASNMGGDMDRAGKDVKELGDKFDDAGSKSSQAAGGLGDLGGALSMMPGPLGKVGGLMETVAPAIMGVTGAADLLSLAANSNAVAWVKNTAATVAARTAAVAGAVATGVMTAAQWALNAAMSLNPIGIVVIAIVALVAALVLAYKKSETFRNIVNAAWGAIKVAAVAVFNFLKAYFVAVFNVYKTIFTGLITGLKKIWGGITWLYTKAVEIGGNIVGWFKGLPGKLLTAIGNALTTLKTKGRDFITGIYNGVTEKWTTLRDWVAGIGGKVKTAIGNVASKVYSIGSDFVSGIKSGISDAWSGFMGWIDDQVAKIPKAIRDFLGISSPSRLMADLVGRPMVEGIQAGFNALSAEDIMKPFLRDIESVSPDVGVSVSGDAMSARGGRGVTVINATFNVAPGTNAADLGRQWVQFVQAYEKSVERTFLVGGA